MDFHKIYEFCDSLHSQNDRLAFIDYQDATEIRAELKAILDLFIAQTVDDPTVTDSYHSGKWQIGFSYQYDGKTPYLTASFKYEVVEQDGADPRVVRSRAEAHDE